MHCRARAPRRGGRHDRRGNVILTQLEAQPQVMADVMRAVVAGLPLAQINRHEAHHGSAPADIERTTRRMAPPAVKKAVQTVKPTPAKPWGAHIGLVDLIRQAIQDGPKSNQEIREWLEKRGHAFNSEQISSSLTGLRNRNEIYKDDGDLKWRPAVEAKRR